MLLVLRIRFRQEHNNERINLSQFVPVNNFFGHFLETIIVSRKEDLKTFIHPLPSGAMASYMRNILKDMSKEQLKFLEKDLLFDTSEIVGVQGVDHADNLGYRLPNLAVDPNPAATGGRRNKFAMFNEGNNGVFGDNVAIHPDNLIWQDIRYVIPMRLLSGFFNINTEVRADLIIKFNLEQDVKRLFKCILPNDPILNNDPTRMKPIFFEAPKILYNIYIFTPRQQHIYNFVMKRIKGKRTGVQPLYHQKSIVIKANSFSTLTTFQNTGAQLEWISTSLVPVLSKEHRNTYATYDAEMANYIIRKITIANLKDIGNNNLAPRVYNLDEFDDQVKLYRQHVAYISNGSSAKTFLDFSNHKEVQNAKSRQTFFTNQASKRLYIDLRDSLGLIGKKDSIKNNNDDITVEISLIEQAREDIHVTMMGQSFHEYVYEENDLGYLIQKQEYSIKGNLKRKLHDEPNKNFIQYQNTRIFGTDTKLRR